MSPEYRSFSFRLGFHAYSHQLPTSFFGLSAAPTASASCRATTSVATLKPLRPSLQHRRFRQHPEHLRLRRPQKSLHSIASAPSLPATAAPKQAPPAAAPAPFFVKRRRSGAANSAPAQVTQPALQTSVLKYSADGSLTHTDFEPDLPCFAILRRMTNKPSLTYKIRGSIIAFIEAGARANPGGDVPQRLSDLAPWLFFPLFSSPELVLQ